MRLTKLPKLNVLWLFAISLWLLIEFSGCATQPPDVPVFEPYTQRVTTDPKTDHMILLPSPLCMEKIQEFECGHGVYILSGKEIWVGEQKAHWFHGKPWSQIKRESIFVPAVESYAPLATYIINSCEQAHCNDQVDRFKVQVDQLKGIGAVLNP